VRLPLSALLTVSAAILASAPAIAGECDQPYTSDALLEDLANVEAAAQANESAPALDAAIRLENGLGCLEEKLVTMLIGRTYRSIGAGYLVGGNETKARRWFRTAIEVDPAYLFGLGEYGNDHPVRIVYDELKMQPSGSASAVEGQTFIAGKFYLDGRKISEPEAIPGRPHLLQRVDDGVTSWVIDGADFPSDVLTSGDAVATGPTRGEDKPAKPPKKPKAKKDKKKKKDTSSGGIARVRPPEKTPLMIAGGALIAGAGGMFVGSIISRQGFDGITDDADALRKAQRTTNRLYLGSFAVLAVGGGVLTYGIILDGGAPMPAIRVRF